jgi:phospholipase/carboxylesterase
MSHAEINNIYDLSPSGGVKPESLVILLHGLGSNGRDLISLAPIYARTLPKTAFVSPDAPYRCDMVPPGYPDSYQWFSLQDRDPARMLKEANHVMPILEAFIKQQAAHYNLPLSKVGLVGFSQGTMMSLHTAPRMSEKLAGVVGYSGALLGEAGTQKLPIHLIHGEADDVVPLIAYTHARKTLEEAGFKISGHSTPNLPHSIDENGIESGAKFLQSVLS